MVQYDYFPKSKMYYCREHNVSFNEGSKCPNCSSEMKVNNSPNETKVFKHNLEHESNPNISFGDGSFKKDKSISEQGFEQGVTITNKANPDKIYNINLSKDVLSASVVSHAFRFVINIPESPEWKNRRQICELKGLMVQRKGGIGNVYMTIFKGFKIWLADRSITIYFPNWKKYYVEQARFGFNYALEDLKCFLNDLGSFIGTDLSFDGIYKFKTSGQHHALIYNSLAKMYNRNKEKLNVYDKNGELWLVIDNSRRESIRMDDLETEGKTSHKDMDDVVQPFFNDLRDNESYKPSEVKLKVDEHDDKINKFLNVLDKFNEKIEWLNVNLVSHEKALNGINKGIEGENEVKRETLNVLKSMNEHFKREERKDIIKSFIDKYR